MAFLPRKTVSGNDVKYALLDNSQTLTIGEVVIPGIQGDTSVVLTGGGTTGDLLGVTMGFKDTAGNSLEFNTYAAESDNVTDKLVKAAYLPLYIDMEYTVALDAAAETTDNSGGFGNFAVDATGLLLSESSYAAFGTKSSKQFFSFGLTGLDTTQVSCRCIATLVA